MKIIKITILSVLILSIIGCEDKIIKGDELPKETIDYIKKLNLLNDKEDILYYYSSYTYKTSGNFITIKRIASFWQNSSKTKITKNTAFYNEIDSIGIWYGDGFEFTSKFIIYKKNGKKFDVHFNDEKKEITKLYNKLLILWKKNR